MVSTKDSKTPAPKPEAPKTLVRDDFDHTPVPAADVPTRPFITAATKFEIEQRGEAIDPFTGQRLTKNDL